MPEARGSGKSGVPSRFKAAKARLLELMPLFANAAALIRTNLEQIRDGHRASLVEIGRLTQAQRREINIHRSAQSLAPINAEVVFIGKHIYLSRVVKDGYTIDDGIDQIANAMQSDAIVLNEEKLTIMENPRMRADPYGNQVKDRVVFECTTRHPRPELFSVIPKGDLIKPK
jgi:hypothetical protein